MPTELKRVDVLYRYRSSGSAVKVGSDASCDGYVMGGRAKN